MLKVLGVLFFVVALLSSVMLHEFGHFLTAKRFGMKATQFFVGFGPTLWSFRRGETEYGVKALPAGGFVKIIGMTRLEEVDPADAPRAFYRQSAPRRAVVLAAGSFVHFVIAAVLVLVSLAAFGDISAAHAGTTVSGVAACVVPDTTATCKAGDAKSPALLAGLRAGDRVTAVDGTPVTTGDDLIHRIRAGAGRAVTLTYTRDGTSRTATLTPVAALRPDLRGSGSSRVGNIGITPATEVPHYGVVSTVGHTATTLGSFVTSTFRGLGRLPSEIPQLLSNKPRDGTGAAGVVDIARVSGDIASAGSVSAGERVADLLYLVAGVNFFVGVFNLLPLLPLDGGHLAILGFEQGRSRLARRLRRPDPGPVDLQKVMPVAVTVIALFVGLSLLLLYAGIANPIKLQ